MLARAAVTQHFRCSSHAGITARPGTKHAFHNRQAANAAQVQPLVEPQQILEAAATLVASTTASTPRVMVLDRQPMLSDLVTVSTGPVETVAWKIALDIVLPIIIVWRLFHWIEWAATQARTAIEQRVQGMGDVAVELRRRSTLVALVLLAMRTPCLVVLRPLLLAYTVRTALHIVELVMHNYRSCLPVPFTAAFVRRLSAQLVLCDAALQTLFNVTGVLFTTWFLIQLKDILIRDLILVRAIKSGRKELERVWTPLSSLMTWAAVLACGISICSSLGVNLEPLLAVGGAGGIAAGFASQQVLTNIVSGINIFLTRPFVIGDQVQFAGALLGEAISGTVEGVEIMRTLVRTTEGTLVAVPNKLVSELVVFNRTRSLTAAPRAEAAAVAAAAPLRRVLCFYIQLDRGLEPLLDEVRADVREFLESTTKQQLKQSGLAAETMDQADSPDLQRDATDSRENDSSSGSGKEGSTNTSSSDASSKISISISISGAQGGQQEPAAGASAMKPVAAAVAAAVSSAVAAVTGSSSVSEEDQLQPPAAQPKPHQGQKEVAAGDEQQGHHTKGASAMKPVAAAVAAAVSSAVAAVTGSGRTSPAVAAAEVRKEQAAGFGSSTNGNNGSSGSVPEEEQLHLPAAQPEPGALLVSITLSKLTEDNILLFVRCEMIIPAATMQDAIQQQAEAALMGVSGLVRDKYGGVLLW